MSAGVIYVSNSKNVKISGSNKVDATYASIQSTCSGTCPLRNDKSCYAMNSFVGMIVNRLDKQAKKQSTIQLARAEAACIDAAYNGKSIPKGRDLRVHVSGDSRSLAGTRIINKAVGRWKNRGGNEAWSYTHSWSHVPRSEWSNVSILASIENVKQVKEVRKQGYAPAIVVASFKDDKAFTIKGSDTVFIPCPAQTKDNVNCVSCRLCMRADWLYESNRGIAFAAHGIRQNDMKKHLTVIK